MTISPWWLLASAVPVLLLGEFLVRRVRWLARFDLPVPVVGGFVLAVAMSSLNLLELRSLAGPMLVILACQVILTVLFAFFVTFPIMGRDYDAAVMSAGHVGFALGITANAVATMDVLTAKFGPAPRAMLIVTIVGAFLIDLTNALTITVYLNLLK